MRLKLHAYKASPRSMMTISWTQIVLLMLALAAIAHSHTCLSCHNSDSLLPVDVRHHLLRSSDVFHLPLETPMKTCHREQVCVYGLRANNNKEQRLSPSGRYESEGLVQCLADDPRCVTIKPNVPDVNYTIRGCFDELLTYPLRENTKLNTPTCFLAKSRPKYSNQASPISFMVCVCDSGKNCNDDASPRHVKVLSDYVEDDLVELEVAIAASMEEGLRSGAIYRPASHARPSTMTAFSTMLVATISCRLFTML